MIASPSVCSILNLARPGERWRDFFLALTRSRSRPGGLFRLETRPHFRPVRLLMPLTLRKDDRELMWINAHDA